MKILHLMVGLPRSGKSTEAKILGFPIVEPDAIRETIHGTPWKLNMEPMVWAIAHIMVESLFTAGHDNVIVDATNHTIERRAEWESENWVIQYHEIKTSAAVCIERAIATKQEILIPVIERMHRQYEPLGGSSDC